MYQEKSDLAMGLGEKIEVEPAPHEEALDFLDAQAAKQRAAR